MPILDTSSQPNTSPSVFDPLYKRAYKAILAKMGMDSPEGAITQAVSPGALGVTIGPKAIPLANESDYLRKVLGSTVDDITHAANQHFPSMYQGAKNILGNVINDNSLANWVSLAREDPNLTKQGGYRVAESIPEPLLKTLIQKWADVFMPTYPEK